MAKEKENRKTCFIITPIGSNGSVVRRKIDGVIEEVIEPILRELGYEMKVSHKISESGSMTNAIIKGVYESDLVIANLTGNNPNVMYEVALRHASAKPIIHITENISELPFDINDQRTIEYTDDMAGALKLKTDLKNMIKNIKYSEPVINPVTIALEKRNLVNIPESTSKEFSDMLFQLSDDMKQMKKAVALLSDRNYKPDTTRYLNYCLHYLTQCDNEKTSSMLMKPIIEVDNEKVQAGKDYVRQYVDDDKEKE